MSNGYDLSRKWFDWCFENPEKISPNHTALYFFCIEHCNRLGWKSNFGLPTLMAKEAIGIRSYNTYIKTLNDLVEFGFIKLIEKSKNQYSSNIIALSNFNKAIDKALDKAMLKHTSKQVESTQQSTSSIDKPLTLNIELYNTGFENIKIKTSEYEKLCKEFTKQVADASIKYLSEYKIEKAYKTKSDNLTIRRWVIDAVQKKSQSNLFNHGTTQQQVKRTALQ